MFICSTTFSPRIAYEDAWRRAHFARCWRVSKNKKKRCSASSCRLTTTRYKWMFLCKPQGERKTEQNTQRRPHRCHWIDQDPNNIRNRWTERNGIDRMSDRIYAPFKYRYRWSAFAFNTGNNSCPRGMTWVLNNIHEFDKYKHCFPQVVWMNVLFISIHIAKSEWNGQIIAAHTLHYNRLSTSCRSFCISTTRCFQL